jgi:AcrR family transcriptional regulator
VPRRQLVENQIYEQAALMFAERGYAGTSLQLIADEMGITRQALYHYFRSKEELLSKLVVNIAEANANEIRELSGDSELDPASRLAAVVRAITLRRVDSPMQFLLLARCEAEFPPDVAQAHWNAVGVMRKCLVKIIDEGIADGVFRPVDPFVTAMAIIGMWNWVPWWSANLADRTAEEVADQLAEFALVMVSRRHGAGPVGSAEAGLLDAPSIDMEKVRSLRTHLQDFEDSISRIPPRQPE